MKVEMIPSRASFVRTNFIEIMLVVAIIAIISAIAIPALLIGSNYRSLVEEFEGKHVVVKGFDEVGLVTEVDGDRLLVYFPKMGEVGFKREMLRVVEREQ